MKFPIKIYNSLKSYKLDYFKSFNESFISINDNELNKVIIMLERAYVKGEKRIMVCGNGGSAALANHFVCDHQKILYETKKIKPNMISLCSNPALMTAISNDNSYEDVFSDQILQIGKKNDILITISSSGNSENIIKAINVAKQKKIKCISLTGFSGGRSKKLAHLNLHVKSKNYGIIESLHHTIMNIISQYLKNKYLSVNQTKKTYY